MNIVEVSTNEKNYKQVVLKRAIIMCWILLAICFVIKIFGGNFFNIVCNNAKFVSVCEYVDRHIWAKYLIGCVSSLMSYYLFYLAMLKKLWFSKSEFWITTLSVVICVGIRLWATTNGYSVITFIVNILQCVIIPLILARNIIMGWFIPVLIYGNIINLSLQIISALVKGLGIVIVAKNSFLLGIIYSIDMYIMLVLYYLYANSIKEKTK